MTYIELEEIRQRNDNAVIFGFGTVGKTIAYETLICAGFIIQGFCDNYYRENESWNHVPLVHLEELYKNHAEDNVFIAVNSIKAQNAIRDQLNKHGVHYVYIIDGACFSQICDSLEKSKSSEARNMYSKVYNDKDFLQMKCHYWLGREIDFDDPHSFNEKIQWLKLHDRNPAYKKMVDKYLAKEYIAEQEGDEFVIPTLGVWNDFDEIEIGALPDQFVLKCTHDSGSTVICNDKTSFNKSECREIIEHALSYDYFWGAREYPYKGLIPRVIAEPLIFNKDGKALIDYKLMCFNGKVRCVFTCTDRNTKSGLHVTFFDRDWKKMPFERHYPAASYEIPKPYHYSKMVKVAESLSSGIPFLRVDFYEVNYRLLIGELTFYPGAGFEEFDPYEYDLLLGEWLDISEV